jgi:RecA/RadA recombinase
MTASDALIIRNIGTGVPGLDAVLGGGLCEYSFNLIAGAPGAGKTTLAQQIIFANATPERPALYFTVLGEPTIKMLRYQQQFEFFDPARTRPRMQRATKALEDGDYQFAGEILGELEAEGHIDTSIGSLRQQLDSVVRRKTVTQLIDAAKARFEEEEDPLALQKLQEVLQMEPDNATALFNLGVALEDSKRFEEAVGQACESAAARVVP